MTEKIAMNRNEAKTDIAPSYPTEVVFVCGDKRVLTLTKDGIYADKDVRVGDAAKAVLDAVERYLKDLHQASILAEREACAQIALRQVAEVPRFSSSGVMAELIACAIRGRT